MTLHRTPPRGRLATCLAMFLIGALLAACGDPTTTRGPSTTPGTSADASPGASLDPSGFILPTPPPGDAAWTALRWEPLAAGDPVAQIRRVVRWTGGFVALGGTVRAMGRGRTPVWTSTDGSRWESVPGDVFGPTTIVMGAGEVGGGLVALTAGSAPDACPAEPRGCFPPAPPIRSWTSPDGRSWTPHPGPDLPLPDYEVALPFATGPGGAVVASVLAGEPRAAVSPDGVTWTVLPAGWFPGTLAVRDLVATASGFAAVGNRVDNAGPIAAWSGNGRAWTGVALDGGGAIALYPAGNGVMAAGGGGGIPGTQLWWASLDGRSWRPLPGYPPVGTWNGEGEGTGGLANGSLAADGTRIVALRPGPDERFVDGPPAGAWSSFDGTTWLPLAMPAGGPPGGIAGLILFPGGVLAITPDDPNAPAWFATASEG